MSSTGSNARARVIMPGRKDQAESEGSSWSKFVRLTQQIVNVPKDETDEQARKHEEQKAKS